MKTPIFLLATLLAATPAIAVDYGDLPDDTFPPAGWSDVDKFDTSTWIVLDVTDSTDVGSNVILPSASSDPVPKIEAIVAASSTARVLYFPAGTYYLQSDLVIDQSNIVIRGDGQGKTELRIAAPASAGAGIRFSGSGFGSEIDVTGSGPSRGDTTVTVASTAGFLVGDVVNIYDKDEGTAFGDYNYTQLAKVSSISGSTLTLDMELGLDFTGDPKVRKVSTIENVGIESLTVNRDRASTVADSSNVEFEYVGGGYAHDVESKWLERGGITLTTSIDVSVRNNRVHHAYNYGVGGQAYGILMRLGTTRCTVVNNKLWTLRHHIIGLRGANHCVVAYNSAESGYMSETGDLNLHGITPHNFLWEGNNGRYLKWDQRSESNAGEYQSIYATGFRNRVLEWTSVIELLDPFPHSSGNSSHESPMIVGNLANTVTIESGVTNDFVGANQINGSTVWGDASSTWNYPDSLFLTSAPAFLSGKPWPVFGPGVGSSFGSSNTLPAMDRSETPAGLTIFIDDSDPEYADSGNWTVSSSSGGYSEDYKHDGNSGQSVTKWATFKPNNLPSGTYKVFVHWKAWTNRASNATVRVYHDNGASSNSNGDYDDFVTDMTVGNTTDGEFHQIGTTFDMSPGDYVGLLNTNANGYVISDAIKLVHQ